MATLTQLLVLGICYFACYLLFFWVWKIKSSSLTSQRVLKNNWTDLHFRHISGIIFMVLVPAIFLPEILNDLWRLPIDMKIMQIIILFLTGAIFWKISAREADQINDNKIRISHNSYFQPYLYIAHRFFFLAGYEWFFRGLVLFAFIPILGVKPAIAINVVLYVIIHSFSGRKEMSGAIPLGIILCFFTIWRHSVWPAIIFYIVLASTYESRILHRIYWKPTRQIL